MPTLTLHGSLDLGQFWPSGTPKGSDADTVKVTVAPGSFRIDGRPAPALDDAYVLNHGKRRRCVSAKGVVTVRLQGIDAPELHFQTTLTPKERAKPNGDFRQLLGESATRAPAAALEKPARGAGTMPITIVSQNISKPNDVFDMYGRLIGTVEPPGGLDGFVSANEWLVAKGWAFPALYDSMLDDEIRTMRKLGAEARAKGRGVWSRFSLQRALTFDRGCLFEKAVPAKEPAGDVVWPKLFRRLAKAWVSLGDTGRVDEVFSKDDKWFDATAWLARGRAGKPKAKGLVDVLARVGRGWRMAVAPGDVVVREDGGVVFDVFDGRGADGVRLGGWG